jgi:hypothetical protein
MTNAIETLIEMLQYRRPIGSNSLKAFNQKFIVPLGAKRDKANNLIVRIGKSRVLWSSHTDSVHNSDGLQKIMIQGDSIKLHKKSPSNCLGADCATGVWIMREMILAGVAGLYVFHDSEEIGGVGASHIANKSPHLLDGIDYAIAFDRKGFDSIITHQGASRTASDKFAQSIAPMLPDGFAPDSGGVFTDTAIYSALISECSNLSVGYLNQHTREESQSIAHAMAMRDAMVRFKESKLIAARDPSQYDYDDYDYWRSFSYGSDLFQYVESNPDLIGHYLDSIGVGVAEIEHWRKRSYY